MSKTYGKRDLCRSAYMEFPGARMQLPDKLFRRPDGSVGGAPALTDCRWWFESGLLGSLKWDPPKGNGQKSNSQTSFSKPSNLEVPQQYSDALQAIRRQKMNPDHFRTADFFPSQRFMAFARSFHRFVLAGNEL